LQEKGRKVFQRFLRASERWTQMPTGKIQRTLSVALIKYCVVLAKLNIAVKKYFADNTYKTGFSTVFHRPDGVPTSYPQAPSPNL
jgi:hypothetical protein